MISRFVLAVGLIAASGAQPQPQAPVPTPPEAPAPAPLASGEARQVASSLADLLEANYVFPDVARRYAAALRVKAASGGYDGAATNVELAEALTADLRAISPDNHLRVRAGGPRGPQMARVRRAPGSSPQAGGPVRMRPEPIEAAKWIAPGIAFIRFNVFPGDPETVAAARRFMEEHADARAIIFDIRTHGGGGLDEMDAMFPYLFERETPLVTMDTRGSVAAAGNEPLPEQATLRSLSAPGDVIRRQHVAIPHASERRLFDAQVFLLTSGFTGSAAEHFALAMKRTGRATLIGEETGGAGHYGGMRPIGAGLSVFVPVGRTFDPDTGRGWEGSGVAPDVAVPAERALVEALTRLGMPQAEAERLSAENAPTRPMRRPTPRA